ncbi:NtaA/DmoA family FMN-dependent monooxygenase [Nakamurella sp. YIM 132087]|uniref:NtaA/DmoA family FMN-dependent monooxygenase n=1 Tax=Nakamurella alba TaxID=2665158 RepID=A0A7K1FR56_9ACTN|nr:LLM class flavin-dependent oxidoreductase [Nakamurella alba]MTD16628.1 NtaA/DmoA family FMN-dependent monooxygenase [Nakamurella alba]
MKPQGRTLHFGVSAGGAGLHKGAWRRPDSRADDYPGWQPLLEVARTAERGKFDAFFLADGVAVDRNALAASAPFGSLEPLVFLAAASQVTTHIGLIGTASTTFSLPYTLARQLATLDHVSGGRAGWNLVTSSAGAQNYGDQPLPNHSDRYRRGDEFVTVLKALWDSWDPESVVVDRASGRFADPHLVRPVDHHGEFYDVAGPLNVPRSPQGRPLIVQAGSSDEGQGVAARHADAVFTAQRELGPAQEFYAGLRKQVAAAGRHPDEIKVLPGLVPIVGDTEQEARQIQADLLALADSDAGLAILSGQLGGVDLTGLSLDETVPPELLPEVDEVQGRRSRFAVYRELALERRWTVRQMMHLEVATNGHLSLIGSAEQIADQIGTWFVERAVDGFNVIPPYSPRGFGRFVDEVIPILQERGLFRQEYETSTLREHLGLVPLPGLRRRQLAVAR